MTKLTETQTIILSAGAQRPENIALPLPKGLAGAAAKMAVAKMIKHGWLQEVDANLRRKEPLWRETGDGHGTTLVVTDAGLLAIGIKPVVVKAVVAIREHAAKAAASKPPTQRAGTKQAMLIEMLQAPEGASIAEIVTATGWMAHTARGAISGVLRKKLALNITAQKIEGRGTVYQMEGDRRACL
ncbi:DUF3489 domain-containing protein [Paracoccus sp. PAR01]|uniref:DUF3489 domain-containing protein n=1 Tax=Paracoccus sp. PAR01 TaxID=2769282 RepID=UPI0017860E88|nr:DUF3489 domain-containing protein [Paracoccus sp. PAR01]MBD9529137.1 DUF3489 domain-containing protein [Paracoccus sp. PAR01]